MKRSNTMMFTLAFLALAVAPSAPVFGQDFAQQAQALLDEIGPVKEKMRLAREEQASLEQEKVTKHLTDTQEVLREVRADPAAPLEALHEEIGRKKAAEREFTARGCQPGMQSSDTALVEECNREIARLNAWEKRLAARARTVAWAEKVKANEDQRAALQQQLNDLEVRHVQVCREMLHGPHTPEEIKLKCGDVQFGNANPNLPPLGGGTTPVVLPTSPFPHVSAGVEKDPQYQQLKARMTALLEENRKIQGKIDGVERQRAAGEGNNGELLMQEAQYKQQRSANESQTADVRRKMIERADWLQQNASSQ